MGMDQLGSVTLFPVNRGRLFSPEFSLPVGGIEEGEREGETDSASFRVRE